MKTIWLLFLGLTTSNLTNGQIIKVQGGTSISKLSWQLQGINVGNLYNETLIGYSIFAGIDYFDKQYFNFSSKIGVIRKGGKGEIQLVGQNTVITDKPTLDYLSIHTTIELKYPMKDKFSPFLSFGPRFDYLLSSSKHFHFLQDIDGLRNTLIGLILGGGLIYEIYDISNLQIGLRIDYYLDFKNVADWTIENTGIGGRITVNTYTVNLTIGYGLK